MQKINAFVFKKIITVFTLYTAAALLFMLCLNAPF